MPTPTRESRATLARRVATAGVVIGAATLAPTIGHADTGKPLGTSSILAAPPSTVQAVADTGFVITSEVVIRNCAGCHTRDATGRLGRLSYLRKTPEGWQASIVRMVSLHQVNLDPEAAREIVRYFSNAQGLAPEEMEPARFEPELRMVEYSYADTQTENTCNACHSMGRVITQRRTAEEWKLLTETHRALYPLIDSQRFRRGGPPPPDAEDPRHPVDRAIAHLSRAFPLDSPEWTAWSANRRAPRLDGSWAFSGHDPVRGPVTGTVTIAAVAGREDEFTTETRYVAPESGVEITRTGRSILYTGYQWRGRSTGAGPDEYREVLFLERDGGKMTGRWFTGEYGELGIDVTLQRVVGTPLVTMVFPGALASGDGQALRVFGSDLPSGLAAAEISLGPGIRVRDVSRTEEGHLDLRVDVATGAAIGMRDLTLGTMNFPDLLAVYDRIDAIRVEPYTGMSRTGGVVRPRQFMQYEAVAYHNGPDGVPGTDDDLRLMRVPAEWSLEEYPETFEDDDIRYVGTIDQNGFFTPAADGPNPERSGNRNNIGTVWVVGGYTPPGGSPLRSRAHLLVTVPNYITFDPWSATQ